MAQATENSSSRNRPLPDPTTRLGGAGSLAGEGADSKSLPAGVVGSAQPASQSGGPAPESIGADPSAGPSHAEIAEDPESGAESQSAPTLTMGETIDHRYSIVRYIGRGGMGEVYEAEDGDLHGRVALKIIRPEIAAKPRILARFRREIQLARKVTHPNVCRIFDVGYCHRAAGGEGEHTTFLTMELLGGETLSQRLRRVGPMTMAEALPVLEQIASGLDAAHSAGIIHRDFKSANVILVSSTGSTRAVITDFGLACSITPDPELGGSISLPQDVVGTPEYMAPEQLKHEPVGPATDVYALGVVMYVMATGNMPFVGKSRQAAALKRIEEPPVSPHVHIPNIDRRWEAVILRCLERDPAARYDSTIDVIRALQGGPKPSKRPVTGLQNAARSFLARHHASVALLSLAILLPASLVFTVPGLKRGIEARLGFAPKTQAMRLAVLPFNVVGGDAQNRAFADGLTETLTAKLSRLGLSHPLQVAPASEIHALHVDSVEQARKTLGASLAVTGGLQRSNGLVRVTLVLIDTASRQELDGDTIDASASDPFSVQDRVVSSVVSMLRIEPRAPERAVLTAHGTLHAVAFDYYLQGQGYLEDYQNPTSLENAISLFNEALKQDPNYALAFAGLGGAYWQKYRVSKTTKWVAEALSACQHAATLNSEAAEAHTCLGTVYSGTGHNDQAVQEFQRSARLDPANDGALRGLAGAYEALGRYWEAESTLKQAIQIRPQYWGGYNRLGAFYFGRSRYRDAADMFTQVVTLVPDNATGYSNLGAAYVAQGDYTNALAPFEKSIAIQPSPDAYSNLGSAYFELRRFGDATRAFESAVKLNEHDYLTWGNLADAYYWTPGERQKAGGVYQKAIALAQERLIVNPRDPSVISDLADYHSMLGHRQDALFFLDRALRLGPSDSELMFKAAEIYDQLGDRSQSIGWLQKAVEAGYSPAMARDTPVLDNLRSDPRVDKLLTVQPGN